MKRFETLFSTSMTSMKTGFLLRSRILCQSETRVNQHFLEAWWTNERVMKQIHNDVSSQSKHLNRLDVECRVNLRVSLMQHKGTIPARFMAQKKVQEPVVLQWCVWLSKKPTNLKWKQHCKSINRNSCCEIFQTPVHSHSACKDTSVFYFSNLPSSRACPERKGVESNDAMKVLKKENEFLTRKSSWLKKCGKMKGLF